MKSSPLVLLLLCPWLEVSGVQDGEARELFSWTSALKRAGGGRRNTRGGAGERGERLVVVKLKPFRCLCGLRNSQSGRQVPTLSRLDKDDKKEDDTSTGVRTGYGYTRGSQEFAGRNRNGRRPAGLVQRAQAGEARNLVESRGRPAQTVTVRTRPSMR